MKANSGPDVTILSSYCENSSRVEWSPLGSAPPCISHRGLFIYPAAPWVLIKTNVSHQAIWSLFWVWRAAKISPEMQRKEEGAAGWVVCEVGRGGRVGQRWWASLHQTHYDTKADTASSNYQGIVISVSLTSVPVRLIFLRFSFFLVSLEEL